MSKLSLYVLLFGGIHLFVPFFLAVAAPLRLMIFLSGFLSVFHFFFPNAAFKVALTFFFGAAGLWHIYNGGAGLNIGVPAWLVLLVGVPADFLMVYAVLKHK